ncbi:MAG: N-6 DNA methylase [Chitinophagales bacterium]|nr:N-6 DNA methylase [Chitinophagales bacterium]
MKTTFHQTLLSLGYRHELRKVFQDFLTLCLCAFAQNPLTGKSHYEDEYLSIIARYEQEREIFPTLLACLITEMTEQQGSGSGNDVLGSFYEQHLYRKGVAQFFTPYPVCLFMANCVAPEHETPQHVLDPCCGAGRMLVAHAQTFGTHHVYYGIDIDVVCVQMTVLNLFLNGIFGAEVMCADALNPDDFVVSYYTSMIPFGIFRITEKEKSPLWNRNRVRVMKEIQVSKPPVQNVIGTQLCMF